MIKKKRVYIKNVANAKFLDRFFYYLLNYLLPDFSSRDYMTKNPLKWSIMTFVCCSWVLVVYLVIIPFLGVPAIIYDACKMPERYCDDDEGWFVEDVWLIRELDD